MPLEAASAGSALSRLPRDWPLLERSRLIRSGGLDWHVQLGGRGPAILFLHGTGASAHSFADVVTALGPEVTAIVPDLPGHGFTEGAKAHDLSLPRIAQRLDLLLDDLKAGPIELVIGHSAGAALALRWALGKARPPRCVIGMNPALIAPPASYLQFVAPLVVPLVASRAMASVVSTLGVSLGMVQRLLSSTNSALSSEQRQRYELLFSKPSHVSGAMGLMAAADLPALLSELASLRSSLCFVLGDQDKWIPRAQLESVIDRWAPSARREDWPGGHLLHEADPNRCAALIQRHLDQSLSA